MKPILCAGLIAGLVLSFPIGANANKRLPPPDAGVSEEELAKLGDRAVPLLIERLQDQKNEKYFSGIVQRLSATALSSGPDPRIQKAFEAFVSSHSQRHLVPFQTLMAMHNALRDMGHVGGAEAIGFLIGWVQTGHKKTRSRDAKGSVEENASELRDAAILGLGLSGDPRGRKFLEDLSEKKPAVPYRGSFMGAVKEALKYSKEKESQKRGAEEAQRKK